MIKTRAYRMTNAWKTVGDTSWTVSDYLHCTYILGFLIRSITMTDVPYRTAEKMFGDKIIDTTKR